MTTMQQEYSFTKLIGQGCKVVTVWYDYDDDTNTINDMAVVTDDGVEIDQYLTEDTLADLEFDCYTDMEKQVQDHNDDYRIDRWIDSQMDRRDA
jgi:hypothetical protein